jgi:hypothetical protein
MVNVPCYSMGTAPRSKFSVYLIITVSSIKSTKELSPGPGAYTKITLMHKLKAPNWV